MGFFDRFQAPAAETPEDPNASRSTMPMPVANAPFGGPYAGLINPNHPGMQDLMSRHQGNVAQTMLNIGTGPRPHAGTGRMMYDLSANNQPKLQAMAQQAGPLSALLGRRGSMSGFVRMIGPDGTEDDVHPSQVQNAMRIGARRIG